MSNDIHRHRCGLHLSPAEGRDERQDPPLAVQGCGYEWEHERIFLNSEDYAQRHACPRCGQGPWFRRVLTPEQERRMAEQAPRVIFGSESVPELMVVAAVLLNVLGYDEKRFDLIGRKLDELRGG